VSKFDANTTTHDVIKGFDLSGKTGIVTGSSAGLGVETSRTLAAAGARVIMVGRNVEKLTAAADGIRQQHPKAQLEIIKMDLANLASVRKAAAEILVAHDSIDLLINNAGIMACPYGLTEDGLELQFGTNHIGHFLFTCLLVPAIVNATSARIVNLSSGGHKLAEVDLTDLNYEERPYDKWLAYGQAKTANVQFTVGLSARLLDKGVRTFAVHPGSIQTELGRHLTEEDRTAMTSKAPTTSKMVYKTIAGGASTSVWAATSNELEDHSGIYLEDCNISQPAQEGKMGGHCPYVHDVDKAEQLWSVSENIVGQRFEFQSY
jgi:NAD(P)-dependent dehydrogenase (short-subunit alcohol dehydrogenase family)